MNSERYSSPIFLCVTLLIFVGCKNTTDRKTTSLQECLFELTDNSSLDGRTIFVIPLNGCSSCISRSVRFLKNNYKSDCEYVISDKSLKKIKFKVGNLILRKNVVLDTAIIFKSKQVVFNSPQIFYCDEGKIESSITLNPQNIDNELMKLREKISAKN